MARFEITWLEDTSDEAVLAELRRVAALIPGTRLTRRAFNAQSRIKSSAVERRFGSWSEATRKAGLTGALPDYSDSAILADLRRVSESCPSEQLTSEFYSAQGQYSPSCLKRRFGGWREALDAVGIGDRFIGPFTTDRMRSQPGRSMSDDAILTQIRDIAARLGHTSLNGADIAAHSEISQSQLYRRFGGVSAALRQAGIQQGKIGRRHTEAEVFENLLRVWTHYGRPPTHSEMDTPPSTVGSHTYIKRYGGWRKALKAFVERANSEVDEDPELGPESPSGATEPAASTDNPVAYAAGPSRPTSVSRVTARPPVTRLAPAKIKPEDRRDPSIGLRFKVLQRDQFRCKLCGRSPATELGCTLHVDHIAPFSKGGKTTLENLRALCAHCNVGKSSRSI